LIFYLSAFPPYFHGWGEISRALISGWVVDHSAPWSRVEAQLLLTEKFVALAGQSIATRCPQLSWTRDEWHGYRLRGASLPQAGTRLELRIACNGEASAIAQLVGDQSDFGGMKHGAQARLRRCKR